MRVDRPLDDELVTVGLAGALVMEIGLGVGDCLPLFSVYDACRRALDLDEREGASEDEKEKEKCLTDTYTSKPRSTPVLSRLLHRSYSYSEVVE